MYIVGAFIQLYTLLISGGLIHSRWALSKDLIFPTMVGDNLINVGRAVEMIIVAGLFHMDAVEFPNSAQDI